MKQQILALSNDGKIYGPFPTQETANTWIQGDKARAKCELYSFWQPAELGTDETAHECGTRLVGIEEASGRKAAGA